MRDVCFYVYCLETILGLILETELSSGEESRLFTVSPDQYVKQVFAFKWTYVEEKKFMRCRNYLNLYLIVLKEAN